ncbi:hypothetical protein DB42_EU00510 [Neochlamydia sp. EPS4]|uniref:hypothetical protein n=1 Tax=Neochlamydia sp. EPS4 TaxID=1478175 RepID=UPI000583163D|nr:hypothetical protein [Neochlamydia sp. EPS4]KIC75705.1 hypothetical protein DB42_EU00510 [Neochlamydia sp. EPS4]
MAKGKTTLQSKKHCEVMTIRVKETITEASYRPGVERWLILEKLGNDQYKC